MFLLPVTVLVVIGAFPLLGPLGKRLLYYEKDPLDKLEKKNELFRQYLKHISKHLDF